MGRRKIEMKMVKDSSSRQVTFSKRRVGLFKKANELATLCAADVAIVVFSPGGKPFSFGHPNVDSVVDKFLNRDPNPDDVNFERPVDPEQDERISDLNNLLANLLSDLQKEKKRGEMINQAMKAKGIKGKIPIEGLRLPELERLKKSLEVVREKAKRRVNEIEASSSLLLLAKSTPDEEDDLGNARKA